jgi:hypothetical protein
MKKIFFSAGFIVLLFVGRRFMDLRINKDYYTDRIIKLKDKNESIILKRNSKLGILTLSNQSVGSETANYEWYIGDESTFDLIDSTTFERGTGETGIGTPIQFDEYQFSWSVNMNGVGFVYLNSYPKFNQEHGPFSWAIVSADSLTNSLIKNSSTSMKKIDVKKKNLVKWLIE